MGQGFFEQRRNNKALKQVQHIEKQEGRALSVFAVQGTQKFEWSNTATIVLVVFMVIFVVAALFGYIIYPGGLILFAGYNATKPRRTVSLHNEAVTVWEHSFWSSKVTGALVVQSRSCLEIGSIVSVAGTAPITVSSNELQALAHAHAEFGPAPAPWVTTPPPPSAPNPSLI